MKAGKALYLEQADNLSGKALFRMSVAEALADRIVFGVENATAMHYLFATLFHPGEMQSVYFLDREPEGVWRYYGMTRTGRNASRRRRDTAHRRSTGRWRSTAAWLGYLRIGSRLAAR